MSNALFLYDEKTPLKQEIRSCEVDSLLYSDYKGEEYTTIIDFTTVEKKEKNNLISILNSNNVISDLTCFEPYEFFQTHSKLKAAFSAIFVTNKQICEICYKQDVEVQKYFNAINIKLHAIMEDGPGFIYPRTFVQIVNEAYFALEENVATKEDIDRAMKFGVNYPFGPFEWSKGKEEFVVRLLKELKNKYESKRYDIAPMLLKEI